LKILHSQGSIINLSHDTNMSSISRFLIELLGEGFLGVQIYKSNLPLENKEEENFAYD
jgi:hypothetical protein